MNWSDVCRDKNGGMKCGEPCKSCMKEAAKVLTDRLLSKPQDK